VSRAMDLARWAVNAPVARGIRQILSPPQNGVERRATDRVGIGTRGPADANAERQAFSLGSFLLSYLWLGATSFGGRAKGYQFDEFVRRRGLLTVQDYMEGDSLSKLLPGPSGPASAVYFARIMGGPLASVLCVLPFVLPGAIAILALTVVTAGADRAPWLDAVLRGVAAGAIGLLTSNFLRTLAEIRRARLGLLLCSTAFLASGILQVEFVLVMAGLVPIALYFNRPRR